LGCLTHSRHPRHALRRSGGLLRRSLRAASHHTTHPALHHRHIAAARASTSPLSLGRCARLRHWVGDGGPPSHAAHHTAARSRGGSCRSRSLPTSAHLGARGCRAGEDQHGCSESERVAHCRFLHLLRSISPIESPSTHKVVLASYRETLTSDPHNRAEAYSVAPAPG
jgi:hypothetical protein